MTRNPVDYDKIAPNYDKTRRGGGPFLAKMVELARQSAANRVLEIGSGTGNNTQAFLDEYPCQLVGIDLSNQMLARAKAKGVPAHLVRASALALPLTDRAVDFVFGVYVLHHIPQTEKLLSECVRVMRQGAIVFVTATQDFIDRHFMNRYFPSFAAIDKARFQPLEQLESGLKAAGFHDVGHTTFFGAPQPVDAAYLEKIENKVISTCELIARDEYAQGLARLRADVAEHGIVGTMQWECLLVWALKS